MRLLTLNKHVRLLTRLNGIATREAAQVQAVFEPFFTNLGQKWQYLKSTLELNLQIWESDTYTSRLRGSSGFS